MKEGQKPYTELTAKDYLKERVNPLLVVYPIDLITEPSDKEIKARFGKISSEGKTILENEKIAIKKELGGYPLMAFAVAFPAKESSKRFVYRANMQKLTELTENLDIKDDEEGEDDYDEQY